ncbi:dual specificity protein phosphatase 1-A-like [Varroa jacobsoni]|uniref:dual specificity protein phosphatase 1-A-like n=1 Tax=Varroa jacobsoni TaxID=62625 RepID=UPI000BFA0E0A|nr:dual specificity protein phosphatase 1-A-like [Varroa jacobsoni]
MPLLLQSPGMFLCGGKGSSAAKGPPRSPGPHLGTLGPHLAAHHHHQQSFQVVMALSFSCENLRNHLEDSLASPLRQRTVSATNTNSVTGAAAPTATTINTTTGSAVATSAGAPVTNLAVPPTTAEDAEQRILILDCRPFLAHSERRIGGSVNVHCPAILRRRLGNRLPLRTVIPDREVRDRLLAGLYSPVVLYEEATCTPGSQQQQDSMAAFVARCLQNEAGVSSVYILEGGFQQFWQHYPHLCVSGPVTCGSGQGVHPLGLNHAPRSPPAGLAGHAGHNHLWPPTLSPLGALSRSSSSPALAQAANGLGPINSHSNNHNGHVPHASTLPWYQQEQQDPVEILPHLFLGSEYHASNKATLQRLKITALLNVSHNCPNHFEDVFRYMAIPVEDSTSEDIGVWFRRAIEFINDVKASGGKVLVHCHAGISRSATICMAYLMATLRLRMEDAYEHVKSRRKIISPNFSFMGQLLSFESQVFSPRGGTVTSHIGSQSIVSQRSPRSPLTSLPTMCNNNNSTGSSPSPRPLASPKTPSERGGTSGTGHVTTAFDFSISPSTLASLVNGTSNGGNTSPSSTPSPTTPLCPSSPYSP